MQAREQASKWHEFLSWLNFSHFLWQTLSSQAALTYDEVVREMMLAEGQYIRDLNMIIKVLHIDSKYVLQNTLPHFVIGG